MTNFIIFFQGQVEKFKEKTKDWDETKALSHTGDDDQWWWEICELKKETTKLYYSY